MPLGDGGERRPENAASGGLRGLLPEPVKGALREARHAPRTLTAFARRLPDFLIVGAQKAGTTSLYAWLLEHPAVAGPASKEVEFFNRFYDRGTRWYRGHFPTALDRTTLAAGEASPDYLPNPWAPRRAAEVVPDARLIVLLRDPVDRALSSYAHELAAGREQLSFEEALDREERTLDAELARMEADPAYYSWAWRYEAYLGRGRYAEQLERWLDVFPREQLLVLGSEAELFLDPRGTYARVLEFLGLPPHELASYPPALQRQYAPMDPATRARLEAYFREPNERLYSLLDRDLGW